MSSKISAAMLDQSFPSSPEACTNACIVNERYSLRQLVLVFWLLALVVSGFQAWADRDWMFGDGISYLDIGEAYLHGNWSMAINGYWSPLYSLILGAMMSLLESNTGLKTAFAQRA